MQHFEHRTPRTTAAVAAPAPAPTWSRQGALIVALGALAALAGCAGLPAVPRTAEPATPPAAPAAWQAPAPAPTPAAAAPVPASAWWTGFGDPLLPAVVEAAQAASPTVSAAAARIEQARAALTGARAGMLPRLEAAGSITQSRATPGTPSTDVSTLGLQAGWELDLFGARAAARDAAAGRLRAADAERHAIRTAVAAEVGSTFVALRACEAQIAPVAADATSREQTAALTEQSARAGIVAPASAALARASAAQGRAQLAQQRAACDLLVKALVSLTALDEADLRARLAAASARQPQPAALPPLGVPADLLARRPDLVAATHAVEAAAADRTQATAERWPQVSLAGSIGTTRIASSAGAIDGTTFSVGPLAVTLPLFDGGRRAAGEAAARAAYDDAVVQLRGALRGAVREVEDALVALQSTAAREADVGIATEGFAASLAAAEARWRGGVGSLFELEDARRSALAAQSALVELRRERATAWINLYRALGGGFEPDRTASR
jgi:NodT family efflux transporter outer membrane factor (OMF) lipoprotein